MSDHDDLVAEAFANVRATAKKRNGHVPNLRRQGTSAMPRRSVPKPKANRDEPTLIPGFSKLEEYEELKAAGGYLGPGRRTGPDGRRPRRKLGAAKLGNVLGKEISDRGWAHEIASGWVTNHWEELVGDKIAQHAKVEMIKDQRLFITCDSTAWATNLKYMQRTILQEISKKVGPDIIVELKIFGPKPPNWRKGALHVKGRGPRDTYG